MDVRRTVTGHDSNGKAVFVSDEWVAPVMPTLLEGFAVHQLWGADETPRLPDDGSLPGYTGHFPPVGGIRFGFTTIPPDPDPQAMEGLDIGAVVAELEDLLPGLAQTLHASGGFTTSASPAAEPERRPAAQGCSMGCSSPPCGIVHGGPGGTIGRA